MGIRDAQRYADEVSAAFDSVDFVYATARDGLLSRLQPVVVTAQNVIDLGTATGSACRPLARRFRGARIIGVDLSIGMLRKARGKRGWLDRYSLIQANAEQLPFADHSVDVVFANLLLPWVGAPGRLFGEVVRVLRKDGLFAFSALGPDSLLELRQALQPLMPRWEAGRFPDMHDLGDAAVRAGLKDPVLDVDRTEVAYDSVASIERDLRAVRAPATLLAALGERWKAGPRRFDLELVFGHCWGSGAFPQSGEYRLDPVEIGHRAR